MIPSTKKMPIPSTNLKHLTTLAPAIQELEKKLRNSAVDYSPDQMAAGWSLIQSYQRAITLL